MRSLINSIIIAFILLLSFQCRQGNHPRELVVADSLMFVAPDSSLHILERFKQVESLSKENRAYYALLLTQARSRNYIKPTSDSLINIAVDYYSKSSDSTMKARTYLYASDVNGELGRKSDALAYIQKATEAAKGDTSDYRLLAYINYFWGRLLFDEPPYEEAEKKFKNTCHYAKLWGDTAYLINTLVDMAKIYILKDDNIAALSTITEGLGYSKESNFKGGNLYALYNYAALIMEDDNQDIEALKFVNESLRLKLTDLSQKQSYLVKGRILMKLNKFDSAQYYLKRGVKTNRLIDRANYNDIMSQLEDRRGNYKAALDYRNLYNQQMDSIRDSEKQQEIMEWQKKYDLSAIAADRDKLKIDKQHNRILILACVVIVLALSIAFIIVRIKFKSRIAVKESDAERMVSVAKAEEKANAVKKEAELTASLAERDHEIDRLKSQNEQLGKQLLSHYPVVRKIKELHSLDSAAKVKDGNNYKLTTAELHELVEAIDYCCGNYASHLSEQCGGLSPNELQMCCLQKLGVELSDMALLLDTSIETLRKRKSRLTNKQTIL